MAARSTPGGGARAPGTVCGDELTIAATVHGSTVHACTTTRSAPAGGVVIGPSEVTLNLS